MVHCGGYHSNMCSMVREVPERYCPNGHRLGPRRVLISTETTKGYVLLSPHAAAAGIQQISTLV
jgi:hypothetical protein